MAKSKTIIDAVSAARKNRALADFLVLTKKDRYALVKEMIEHLEKIEQEKNADRMINGIEKAHKQAANSKLHFGKVKQ